ncbi:MAG: Asp23/Gls24 family envelope stress response protein [Erysipelotrichaceae bacterium]|nr:Asp23/Gls24 family envelope stress response protein [Erysipelotrichaceae bacterium]
MNISNSNGEVTLSKGVFKDIVSTVIKKFDVFFPIKKDNSYINVDMKDNDTEITIHIKIKQGVDVVKTCKQLQNEIYETIYQMIGIEIKKIHIDIVGFER